MGTGSFLDVVTSSPHASLNGEKNYLHKKLPRVLPFWYVFGNGLHRFRMQYQIYLSTKSKKWIEYVVYLAIGLIFALTIYYLPKGLVPLVAWKIHGDTSYLAEGSVHDTGIVMEWARSIDLFQNIEETSQIADSAASSGGVYFIPGFHGLQAPVMDPTATAGFLGNMMTKSRVFLAM